MLSGLLSASFGYADIAFLVILGLCLLLGLIRGIAKSFKGFFLTIAIILLSLFLLGLSFPSARDLDVSNKLEGSLTSAAEGWGAAFNDEIYFSEDGSTLMAMHDGQLVELKSLDKGVIANWLGNRFITENGQTVGGAIVGNITSLITSIILFIVFCIALGIVAWIIRKVTEKMHFSDSGAVKAIDRIVGGVIASGLGIIFVLFVLAIFASLADKMPTVISYITESPICGFFYTHNPVATVLTNIFG